MVCRYNIAIGKQHVFKMKNNLGVEEARAFCGVSFRDMRLHSYFLACFDKKLRKLFSQI